MKKLDPTRPATTPVFVQTPAGAPLEKAPEPHALPSAASALSPLKLELARRQLDLVSAQAYAKRGLENAPRERTDAKLEHAVDAAFREGDPVAAARMIDGAYQVGGAGRLRLAIEIFDAQAEVWFANNPDRARRVLDAVIARALDLLAADPPKTDHARALSSMIAANRALACGRSNFVLYALIVKAVASADAFSNEPGFPDLCDRLDVRGGAVVGVSGALLELGARGAELVVSVDANPMIPNLMLLLSGLLLAADKQAQEEGIDANAQAERFMGWLKRGADVDTTRALKSIGYPDDLLGQVDEQLTAMADALRHGSIRGWPLPKTLWCQGPKAGEHVQHLTRLALEGRIVAVTADLADPEVVSRINRVLELHGLSAKVFHFSNALDYIPNVRGTFANFERLRRTEDAVITTTAYHVRHAGQRLQKTELTNALGTLEEPAALVAGDWFGATANALHDLLWSDAAHRAMLVRDTFARAGKTAPESPPADYDTLAALIGG